NSAMWIGETIADVIGYPLAAIFVGFLGSALPLAFWFDAATYAASAALLATTLQATVGQFTIGALTALTPYYAIGIVEGHAVSGETAYGFLETAIGVGNLIGGFVIGFIGTHLARGRT